MKYLTQILNKRVLDTDGKIVGKVVDAIATTGGRLPVLRAIIIHKNSEEIVISYDLLSFNPDPEGLLGTGSIQGDLHLTQPFSNIPRYSPLNTDIRLRRDVLDRQIVDVLGSRVVRVSDVRLAESAGLYRVVGVDASLRATLRRLGWISKAFESIFKWTGKPLRSNLIAWDDVQTLEAGTASGGLKLRVSHDKIAQLHPADIADIMEQLSPQQGAEVIGSLDTETAADAMAEADPDTQVQIMQQLDDERATDILEEMEPDEAADLLDDLPDSRSDELLLQMEPDEARDVKELLAYDEDTAGGLMTTEVIVIPKENTCEQTIAILRELSPKAETIYYLYVVDEEDQLVGVLSLRDLIISPPSTRVADIMVHNVIHVYVDDHADQVAQVIGRYNLLAVPVVSEDEKLLGIITVDDTMERLLPPERRRKLPIPALTMVNGEE